MGERQPHQTRVVDEKTQLDEKLDKLLDFLHTSLFETLPQAEQNRLKLQSMIMAAYSEVLRQRIGAF